MGEVTLYTDNTIAMAFPTEMAFITLNATVSGAAKETSRRLTLAQ